jgi:tetraacyldisaccharide 4'-kinase
VLAGRDRRVTGRLAVERFAPDVVVLDDGMQFYQLHRDVDVVLLNAVRPFGNGRLLPRGLLREPPSHLGRAGFVVLTHVDEVAGDQVAALKRRVAALVGPGRVAEAAYSAAGVRPVAGGETSPAASLAGRKVAAVSALGHPEGFEGLLERVGADLTLRRRFPDHHAITPDEMEQAAREAREAGAELLAATEKDAVKLPVRDFALPVVVLSAELDIIGHGALDEAIRQALARAGSKA